VFDSLKGSVVKILELNKSNLQNWISYDEKFKDNQNFAYLRSIGVYHDGDTDRILPIENVLYKANAYDTSIDRGAYGVVSCKTGSITLNK
jgi:hypothetical protein